MRRGQTGIEQSQWHGTVAPTPALACDLRRDFRALAGWCPSCLVRSVYKDHRLGSCTDRRDRTWWTLLVTVAADLANALTALARSGDGARAGVAWIGNGSPMTARNEATGGADVPRSLLALERAARAAAESANRAKDLFLATVSHELRTPLQAILWWVELLRSQGSLDEATRARGLEIISRNIRAQARLVEDLLDVSSIVTGKLRLDLRVLDLSEVIDAAIDAVHTMADAKGIRLDSFIDPATGPILGDPARLQQVLCNLLSNAVKFTPAGGRIEVRLLPAGTHVELRVTDSGIGLSPEALLSIFDRFRQAENSRGGLGLGLSIVRELVVLHGGTAEAQSGGAGLGATFILRFPVARGPVEPGDNMEFANSLFGVHALVVDEHGAVRELASTILRRAGAEVTAVPSAELALDILSRAKADVLVIDVSGPAGLGFDTLIRQLRARESRQGEYVPAVALATYGRRTEDQVGFVMAGFQAHVCKPIQPRELIGAVARVTGRTEP
jgi:signal transduction histidine kinase